MNKLFTVVAMMSAVALGWLSSSQAQEGGDKAVPVEFFACNWQPGKGMADLDKVTARFVKYADKNDAGYSAWILTPQFYNSAVPAANFQVGWLGSWPDANAFGRGQDSWQSKGGELATAFSEVIDCSNRHELASSVVIHAPDGPPDNGVVMFYACNLHDGKSPVEAIDAGKKLAGAMTGLGAKSASWLFFPALGAGNTAPDFWRVIAFPNYTALGAAAEIYTNGGGWQKAMEILGSVATCHTPGVYDASLVRNGAAAR